jgi:hypothetical protein
MIDPDAKLKASVLGPAGDRIFLALPGDVRDERALARAVIEQLLLERAFRGRLKGIRGGWGNGAG